MAALLGHPRDPQNIYLILLRFTAHEAKPSINPGPSARSDNLRLSVEGGNATEHLRTSSGC
jgi:hypothetical protein